LEEPNVALTPEELLHAAERIGAAATGRPAPHRPARAHPPASVYRLNTAAGRRAWLEQVASDLDRALVASLDADA
jgi:hypothetical protein